MEWVGYREVPIKRLVMPGDLAERMVSPHVAELAESFAAATGGEPGNVPWVQAGTWEVVAGRDRVAALMLRKADRAWVRVGKFSTRELLVAEVHENLRRRQDDRDALLARLVDETERELAGKSPGNSPRAAGRPQTPRGAARERVAKDVGVSTEAVRSAERRVADREMPTPVKAAGQLIETWGAELHAADEVAVIAQHGDVDAAERAVNVAIATIRRVGGYPGLSIIADQHVQVLRAMASWVKSVKYAATCCYCMTGGTVGAAQNCSACKGLGFLRADQMANLPPEVTSRGEASFSGPAPAAVGRSSALRKVSIVDEDGNPIDVEMQGDPEPDIAQGDVGDEEIPF